MKKQNKLLAAILSASVLLIGVNANAGHVYDADATQGGSLLGSDNILSNSVSATGNAVENYGGQLMGLVGKGVEGTLWLVTTPVLMIGETIEGGVDYVDDQL